MLLLGDMFTAERAPPHCSLLWFLLQESPQSRPQGRLPRGARHWPLVEVICWKSIF